MQGDPLILLADGRTPVLNALAHALRESGYYVVAAQNGLDAVRLARNAHPEAVLLGGAFPDFDAEVVADFLADDWDLRCIPVIPLPALAEASESGAFSARSVVEAVGRSLRSSRRPATVVA